MPQSAPEEQDREIPLLPFNSWMCDSSVMSERCGSSQLQPRVAMPLLNLPQPAASRRGSAELTFRSMNRTRTGRSSAVDSAACSTHRLSISSAEYLAAEGDLTSVSSSGSDGGMATM